MQLPILNETSNLPPRQLPRQVRILLVDDDPTDLVRHVRMLERQGCHVIACDSHLTALACLETMWPDGVLVNQGADRFAWRSVVDRAMRRTPVLVMTDCRDVVCQLEAIQLGAVGYFEKPLTGPQVMRALDRTGFGPSPLPGYPAHQSLARLV